MKQAKGLNFFTFHTLSSGNSYKQFSGLNRKYLSRDVRVLWPQTAAVDAGDIIWAPDMEAKGAGTLFAKGS